METVEVIPVKCLWLPGGKAAHLKQRIDDSLVFLGAEIAEHLRYCLQLFFCIVMVRRYSRQLFTAEIQL